MSKPTFNNTRDALIIYDASEDDREKAWEHTQSDRDVFAAEAADLAALNKVREAYFLDTKLFNYHDTCMLVPLHFMREMATKYSGYVQPKH